jgi:hypothetical protein
MTAENQPDKFEKVENKSSERHSPAEKAIGDISSDRQDHLKQLQAQHRETAATFSVADLQGKKSAGADNKFQITGLDEPVGKAKTAAGEHGAEPQLFGSKGDQDWAKFGPTIKVDQDPGDITAAGIAIGANMKDPEVFNAVGAVKPNEVDDIRATFENSKYHHKPTLAELTHELNNAPNDNPRYKALIIALIKADYGT